MLRACAQSISRIKIPLYESFLVKKFSSPKKSQKSTFWDRPKPMTKPKLKPMTKPKFKPKFKPRPKLKPRPKPMTKPKLKSKPRLKPKPNLSIFNLTQNMPL
jgi:outer membrane biosynthesis protein TonB